MARTGNASGRHAERMQIQRSPVDTRLPGGLRRQAAQIHARRTGRRQFWTVAE